MRGIETLIVGAGPTGIGAAWACERGGQNYLLVDRGTSAGGLARTVELDGYRWDLGGHVIHSHFKDFDDAIRASGVRTIDVRRSGTVLLGANKFVPVPIQQQLDSLPTDIQPGRKAENLAQYFQYEMGRELYESFFFPFNTKMWAYPLVDIEHTWTSLRSGSRQANVPRVGLKKAQRGVETFPYPEGGTGMLWDSVAAQLNPDRQLYNLRLRALDIERHIAIFDNALSIEYAQLITTIPLDQLCEMAGNEQCRKFSGRLVHTQVSVLGFGFSGTIPDVLADKTYIYGPDPQVPWYRATVLSNYSSAMAPEGCWNILFECGSSLMMRSVDLKSAAAACLRSLSDLGVDLSTLDKQWSYFLEYGYPVPVLGRDEILRNILSYFSAYGVFSRGRFGGWRYESCNQDYSFAQGVEAVVSGRDDVLWHPERY